MGRRGPIGGRGGHSVVRGEGVGREGPDGGEGNEVVGEGQVLRLEGVARSDVGEYSCREEIFFIILLIVLISNIFFCFSSMWILF